MKLLSVLAGATAALAVALPQPVIDKSSSPLAVRDESLIATPIDLTPTSADEIAALEKRKNYATISVAMGDLYMPAAAFDPNHIKRDLINCLSAYCPPDKTGVGICLGLKERPASCSWKLGYEQKNKWKDGFFSITALENALPANHYGVREGLIHSIAAAYEAMVSDKKNCVSKKVEGKEATLCTVSNFINVMARDFSGDGGERAWMTIKTEWEADKPEKDDNNPKFDCWAIKEEAKKRIKEDVKEEFSKAFGQNKEDVDYKMNCVSGEYVIVETAEMGGELGNGTTTYALKPGGEGEEPIVLDGATLEPIDEQPNELQRRDVDKPKATAILSRNWMHVGEIANKKLHDKFIKCLDWLCPTPRFGKACDLKRCGVGYVEYSPDKHGIWADEQVHIQFIRGEWPYGYTGTREALGETVASALQASTAANCYRINIQGPQYWCNAPNAVGVKITNFGPDKKLEAHLYVAIKFSGMRALGKFNCDKTLPDVAVKTGILAKKHYLQAFGVYPKYEVYCTTNKVRADEEGGVNGGFNTEEEWFNYHNQTAYDPAFWEGLK